MSAARGGHGLTVASVVAGLALVVGTLAGIARADDRGGASANGAFGAISCSAPSLPGAVVDARLSDLGASMMSRTPMRADLVVAPNTVRAGTVSFVAANTGALVHELVVLPLPADGPGTTPTGSDGKIDESASRAESSRSCAAGSGDGIAPGSTAWTATTLTPGRYEVVCDMPWHYTAGMFDVLTVT